MPRIAEKELSVNLQIKMKYEEEGSEEEGDDNAGAAYPAEDVVNKLPALDEYKLGWKARELCRRAQELWDARFGKAEKPASAAFSAPSAPAAPVAPVAPFTGRTILDSSH